MMPVTTSRASDTMLKAADAGPPVSGNTEAVGVAVALAEGLGEPSSDGNGVNGPPVVLAIGLPPGSTHTVTDSPPAAGLVVQPDGATLALGLEDCATAAGANTASISATTIPMIAILRILSPPLRAERLNAHLLHGCCRNRSIVHAEVGGRASPK